MAKRTGWRCLLVTLFLLCALVVLRPVLAESYSIDWHTIDGGGGTSTSGMYGVSGAIGQPDAGIPMTNGQYSVKGGFWVLPVAVQVAGGPTLSIASAATGFATVFWTPVTNSFVLQESLSLLTTNWINSPSGATNPVTVPVSGSVKYYRLQEIQP